MNSANISIVTISIPLYLVFYSNPNGKKKGTFHKTFIIIIRIFIVSINKTTTQLQLQTKTICPISK